MLVDNAPPADQVWPPSVLLAAAVLPDLTATNTPSAYVTLVHVPLLGRVLLVHAVPLVEYPALVPPLATATKYVVVATRPLDILVHVELDGRVTADHDAKSVDIAPALLPDLTATYLLSL